MQVDSSKSYVYWFGLPLVITLGPQIKVQGYEVILIAFEVNSNLFF